MTTSKIIYTQTDEAPALATHSLLPIVQAFAASLVSAGVRLIPLGQTDGEAPGQFVVLGQSFTVAQGDPGGRGDHAHLAHPTAEALAHVANLRHELGRPTRDRPDGSPQALGETELDGVGAGGVFLGPHPGCGYGVEDPRPIDVDAQAVGAGHLGGLIHDPDRDHPSAGQIVGVLPHHEVDAGEEPGHGHRAVHVLGLDAATLYAHGAKADPGECLRRAGFRFQGAHHVVAHVDGAESEQHGRGDQ